MGCLFVLNDLSTAFREHHILGSSQIHKESIDGKFSHRASQNIIKFIAAYHRVEEITASDDERLSKYIHHLRFNSYLANVPVRWTQHLRERNFGVLNQTWVSLNNSMFTHSRILAEGGESLAELMRRALPILQQPGKSSRMIISHPFVCQVLFNSLTGQIGTKLSKFWINQAGSCMVVSETESGKSKFAYYNAVADKEYTIQDFSDATC